MKKTNRQNQWEANEKKMRNMCDKFINILETIDGYSSWESMILERMISKLREDSGLSNKLQLDGVFSTLENELGFVMVPIENLAQQIRLEQFLEDLKENPCQLKLIA